MTATKQTPKSLVLRDFVPLIEQGGKKHKYKVARFNAQQKQKLRTQSKEERQIYNTAFKRACLLYKENRDSRAVDNTSSSGLTTSGHAPRCLPKSISGGDRLQRVSA